MTGDDPIRHYSRTLLVFGDAGIIDLRKRVGQDEHRLLQSLGLAREFAVITAHNPRGAIVSPEENDRRQRALEAELGRRGIAWVPATGTSVDGTHAETGCAIAVSAPEAEDVAVMFEQVAYYWFDGERFSIRGACLAMSPVPLPVEARDPPLL